MSEVDDVEPDEASNCAAEPMVDVELDRETTSQFRPMLIRKVVSVVVPVCETTRVSAYIPKREDMSYGY